MKEKKEIKISLGLPWVSLAIGVISGWLAIGGTEGILIGAALGIVVALVSYLGLVPFVGWWIYSIVINMVFNAIGYDMPILFWWGMVCAIIVCIITSFIAIVIIIFGIGEILE